MEKERKNPAQKSTEILIAEDSITQALQIKHLLESHHYKVSVTQNGKQAIDLLSKHKPSLVISDIIMPEMNGYELCKKIKSDKNTEDIPVILLTILSDPEEIIEGLSCGADSFITKPYNEKYLLSHIEKILSEGNGSDHKKVPFGVQIHFKGKKRFIQAEQQNVIKLMLNIYEGAIQQNERLFQTREELRLLNERLESIVEDRTSDLSEEIKLSKQIANRLKESEERFRALYNDAVVGLYRTNLQGEILLANHAMVKMLGFSSFEEMAARNLKSGGFGPSYSRQKFVDRIEKEGMIKDLESSWIDRDGKEIFVRESAKVIYGPDKKILCYDGTVQDITEQKRAAEALTNIQHLFETLAQVSPVGIFRTDLDGYTTYMNPKWLELSGLTSEEGLGLGWLKAVHPDDRKQLEGGWKSVVQSQMSSTAEYRFLRSDGSIVWVMGNAVPEWIDNEIIGYIGTITDITERKRAEEALVESETKYRQLVTRSPDGIFIVDLSGKFLSANKAICDSLRCTEEELLSMKLWDIVPEQYQSIHKQRLMAIMNGEITNANAEYEVKGKDGIIHSIEVLSVPYYKGKEIIGFQGIARDITERKKAEEELRESESSLRDAQEIAKMGSWEWDLVTQKTNWSDNYFFILGFEPTEVEPGFELFRNKIHPDDVHFLNEIHANIMKDKTPSSHELRLIQADGTLKWIQNYILPVIKDDKLVKLKGVIIDITERKRTEKILLESEEKYRRIFENVQDLYYESSIDGTILEVSPSIEILSKGQYNSDDLIGKSIFDFYSEPKERQVLLAVLQEKGAVTDFEITLKNRDGSNIPCSISSKICFDVQGRPEKIIGSMRDITDRRNVFEALNLAKEKAEASDKLKTSFLNNISHEVRTPLNGILGFAEIMSHHDLSEEMKKDSLSMLSESSDRLLNTITNYMDISLITSGNMSVHKKDFIPGQVLRKIFDNYKTICSNRKLELLLEIPEQSDNLSVNSDPEIFRKIISHLLNNAIKFTEKGRINFGYIIHEGEFEFFMKDTGIGIGKESINNIFDHFVKEDRGPSILTEGSGLGLSIAKGMIEIIGGNIRVESEMGVGSCFYFTVPFMKDTEITLSGTSGKEHKKIIGGASILVAEDDETNFFYLNALITSETRATVLHASNGREAIELFKANPGIQLILMDIKMPEIDGFEATRQIKLIKKEVPVIAITAYAMSGDEERVLAAGCDGYLSKPISKKSLLAKIEEFIEI